MYEEQKALQEDITKLVRSLLRSQPKGVPKAEVVEALKELFKVGEPGGKAEERFKEVVAALGKDVTDRVIKSPEALFAEDENFNQGHFAEAVRRVEFACGKSLAP